MNEYSLKEKNKGWQYKNGKSVYMIPSDLFPLASKKKSEMRIFHSGNTEVITDQEVIKVFNMVQSEAGSCYKNAKGLQLALEHFNINDWEFYAGWFFFEDKYPVHHAWLVKDNHVLCFTLDLMNEELINKMTSHEMTMDEQRKILLDFTLEQQDKPNSETRICGKLFDGAVFIGTKDNIDNCVKTVRNLPKDHISYRGKGMSVQGHSKLNKMIHEKMERK